MCRFSCVDTESCGWLFSGPSEEFSSIVFKREDILCGERAILRDSLTAVQACSRTLGRQGFGVDWTRERP